MAHALKVGSLFIGTEIPGITGQAICIGVQLSKTQTI